MPRTTPSALTAALLAGVLVAGAATTGCNRTPPADKLLSDAKQYQQKGDSRAALIQLKNALAQQPDDPQLRLSLGEVYNELGDALSAEKEYRKAMTLGASAAQALPGLARSLLAQAKYQLALTETEAAVGTGDAAISTVRGQAWLGLNQLDKAKLAFEQALVAIPGDLDATLGLARHAQLANQPEQAMALAEQAAARHPASAEPWLFEGQLLRTQGRTEPALAAYTKALALQPTHRTAHIDKAYLEILARKYDAAQADIDLARKATPENLMVHYTQALLDFTQGKFAHANDSLLKVLRGAPDHLPSLLLGGAVQLKLGSPAQAEQYLKKYLENRPADDYARKMLATTLLAAKRPQDARAVLAPLLQAPASQQDTQLLAMAGEAYMQSRDFGKASEYLEKASALAPNMAALHGALGVSKLGLGEGERGVRELERAAALDTKSATAGLALVKAELGQKHFNKALAAAVTMEKTLPDNATLHDLKGGAYVGLGDFPKARASFDKALALQPDFFAPVINLAQLDLLDKKPAQAGQRMQAFLDKNPKSVEAMLALADFAGSQGQTKEMLSWLERANRDNPDAVVPAHKLAVQYLRNGQQQKALTLARKLHTANPSNPDVLDLLGQAQLAGDDRNGALETYSKMANLGPKQAPAYFRMAQVHALMKNDAAASKDLNDALAIDPNYLPALIAKAEMGSAQGGPEQMLALARRVQKLAERSPAGFALEGDALLKQGKFAAAAGAYEQAFTRGKNPMAMIKLHHALTSAGRQADADARIAQWQKSNPSDALSTQYLADAAMAAKQNKAAIGHYEALLKLQPKNAGAANNLAWLYQQEKDARALPTAELALQLEPNGAGPMDTLGWILASGGQYGRALPLLKKAAELAPDAADIRYHLAAALAQSGDKPNARKEVEKLLAGNKPFPQRDEARALLKQL